MIQSLHIFRKDVRHLWPELTGYVALVVLYGWAEPKTWMGAAASALNSPGGILPLFLSLLRLLFPLVWLAMIARLMQDESLVGDQQFWITRPYSRASLLGAKLLFVGVCIMLPFAAMQCCLVMLAGLHPLSAVPGLLSNLVYLGAVCWLPFMAIASITSTLTRMIMTVIGAFVAFFLFTLLVTIRQTQRLTPPFVDESFMTLFVVLFIALLVWQYGTRRTTIARVALVAVPVLLVVLRAVAPADLIFLHRYPIATDAQALHVAFDPDFRRQRPQTSKLSGTFGKYVIEIPIQPQPATEFLFDGIGVSFTIDAPGMHYTSPWQHGNLSGQSISTYVSQSVVEQLHGNPANLHVAVIFDRLRPGTPQMITMSDSFNVPNNGYCFFQTSERNPGPDCRYAFQGPPPTVIRKAPAGSAEDAHRVHASLAKPSFDPIVGDAIRLKDGISPGSQLAFTVYQPADRARIEFDVPGILLDRYIVAFGGR